LPGEQFEGPFVRLLRLIAGTGSVESRVRRVHIVIVVGLIGLLALWTWTFVKFDLGFGVGIDVVLVLLIVDQINRARKPRKRSGLS
jgi:hypothetical protein